MFYIVSTPIGNIEDITLRAKRILGEVDYIATEDTREAGKLLKLLDIPRKEFISYRDQNHDRAFPQILQLINGGKSVALISDRGTPTISDPGFKLVRDLQAEGIQAISIPGVSAVISALSISGLPTDNFTFLGFLSKKAGKQKSLIEQYKDISTTLVLYESPFRVVKSLENIFEVLGDIRVAAIKELTKVNETVISGRISEVISKLKDKKLKGEWVIVVENNND